MKIRRISGFQKEIQFPNLHTDYTKLLSGFYQSRLGKIHRGIPWQEMVKVMGIKEYSKGPRSIFSCKGKVALMFLKHYAACSDRKLIEQLNGNIYYQIFCDIMIDPLHPIKNYKIVSQIRTELSAGFEIEKVQQCLAEYWKPYMSNLDSMCCDATCYESSVRYPTDIKLLWETVSWNYNKLQELSKRLKQRMIRTKMIKWTKRYRKYSKSRNPRKKEKRGLRRALLLLLEKIDAVIQTLENKLSDSLSDRYWQRRGASQQVLAQQKQYFADGISPKNRIVSIDKPYLRPIVRGKEKKPVEFGMKAHKVQVDGISFLEHLSFDAFNEGTRLKSTVWMVQKMFGKRIKVLGADGIYATNANRKFATNNQIKTDFKRKGKPSKHKGHFDQLAHMITKERATRLEGSFGTDKEHFLLKKIMARTKQNEILWIFFGIHTSNALKIGQRIHNQLAIAA